MIHMLTDGVLPIMAFIGVIAAFALTCFFTSTCSQYLPKDMGR